MKPSFGSFVCCALVVSTRVGAQPSRDAATQRRELLERASESSRRGDHPSALRLGEEASRIQVTPSVQMFLAEEHEFLVDGAGGGAHLLDAMRLATTCVRDATAQTALNNRERILQRCAEVVGRLNPRVAHVRVLIDAPAPDGMSVRLGERELPRGLWGEPVPVLPGVVIVDASAPDHEAFHRALRLPAGATEVVRVVLPGASHTGESTASRGEDPARAREAPPEATSSSALPITGWTLVGLGAVAGAVGAWQWSVTAGLERDAAEGTGAYGSAWGRYHNSINRPVNGVYPLTVDDLCSRAASDASTNSDAAQAHTMCEDNAQAKVLAWSFGLGGLALAAVGATLVLVGGRRVAPRVTTSAILAPGVGGVSVRWTF